ncbi:PH domain-containing protein [Rhizobiales bacterium RZME27]|uniref:PH domain-containing protein n=1 Tax=Endobacterium cereale TaxID=2663029 RepID=A0A6A8A1X8_9HYPH|nr:PH domain-containing protein [Endobacterium cereale]MEB2843483.1 PH domain-containing protein [Endobacterium cereale]MQY44599.1 PH domain-containing protein [Endobacterium cereale]
MGIFDGLLGHGSAVDPADLNKRLNGVLIEGEAPELAFRVIRDFFVFTQFRVILVDIQGMTGTKVDYMSIPYRAVTRFSVETAGTFDLDSELKIWVSGSSEPIARTLKKGADVRGIQRALATGVLR